MDKVRDNDCLTKKIRGAHNMTKGSCRTKEENEERKKGGSSGS